MKKLTNDNEKFIVGKMLPLWKSQTLKFINQFKLFSRGTACFSFHFSKNKNNNMI